MMRDLWYRLRLHMQDALVQVIKSERVPLGSYSPSTGPSIGSPVLLQNRTSNSTLLHERCHEWLASNTPFGVFSQVLSNQSKRDISRRVQSDVCQSASWGCHEGFATYSEVALTATERPEEFDSVVSSLPTHELGGAPYREWYDRLNDVLPLEPIVARQKAAETTRYVSLALGVTAYAMSGLVLHHFKQPGDLTTESLTEYLEIEAPDTRLRMVLNAIEKRPGLWNALWQDTEGPDWEQRSTKVILERIAMALPNLEFMPTGDWESVVGNFAASWNARVHSANKLAEIVYPMDWIERVTYPAQHLTSKVLDNLLLHCDKHTGLLCNVSMYKESELHLAVLPFPIGGSNEETWSLMLKMLNEGAATVEGVLSTRQTKDIFTKHPQKSIHLGFIRESWRIWDKVMPSGGGLTILSEEAAEFELSEKLFGNLLDFRDLRHRGKWQLLQVSGEQYAAIIIDPTNCRSFVLQSVQGSAGLQVFGSLVEQFNLTELAMNVNDLPTWPTIRLAAQGFLP